MNVRFSALLKEEWKKRKMLLTVLALAVFLALPYPVFLDLQRTARMSRRAGFEHWFGLEHWPMSVLLSCAGVILALSAFRSFYLNRKEALGQELTASRQFLLFYMTGLTMLFLIYGGNFVLALGILFVGNGLEEEILTLFYSAACHLIFSGLIYTVAAAAMGTSGTRSGCIWMIFVFLFQAFIGTITWLLYCNWNFITFVTSESLLTAIFSNTSPVSAYLLSAFIQELPKPGKIMGYALAWAIWAGIAWILFRRKSQQDIGKPVLYVRFGTVIRILVVVNGSLWAAWASRYFSQPIMQGGGVGSSEEKIMVTLLALFAGAAAAHGISELVYHSMKIRRILCHKGRFALCFLLSSGLFFSIRLDLWGYDRFYPDREKVDFVALEIPALDGWVSSEKESYGLEYMKLTNPEFIYPLIEQGRKQILEEKEWWQKRYSRVQSSVTHTVIVKYHMKSGRDVLRGYYVDHDSLMAECKTLFQSLEYKRGAYPVLSLTASQISEITLEYLGQKIPLPLSEEEGAALLSCYQKDFEELELQRIQEESPNAVLSFQKGSLNPLYSTFHRTRTFLKERGFPDGQLSPDQVAGIKAVGWSHYGCIVSGGEPIWIRERGQVEEVLQCSAYSGYAYMNCWKRNYGEGINVTVFTMDGNEYSFEMDVDRAPFTIIP